MRIVVVNNFFPPRPGGSSHLADHLAREYAARGHEVLVITAAYRDAPERESRDGFDIVRIPAWILPKNRFAANFDIAFTISPRSQRAVDRVLDEFRPDVIHQHGQFFDLTWQTGIWARRHKVPTLLSIHTRLYSPNPLHDFVYRCGDALLVKPLMWLHKPELVVMDVFMDRYIRQRYRGAHRSTVTIPVGVHPDTLAGGAPGRFRKDPRIGGKHLIASVGHVIAQRNRLPLVEALPRILERFPETVVVVIGTVYDDAFLHRAKELGVDHAVIADGALPQREIPDILADADLETHELDGQGFGTASLEALAAGVPVVAAVRTDNFLSEVTLVDGEHLFLSGFVSEHDERADPHALAETICAVLADPAGARERVAAKARALIDEHFTIAHVTDLHERALERLIGVRARR